MTAKDIEVDVVAHSDSVAETKIVPDVILSAVRVSVVVPTLNEAENLPLVFDRMPPEGLFEVILVDGASLDGTIETARRLLPDVHVVHQTRSGKGNALACGFAASRGDIIVMLDADGSADPQEIPRFVDALLDGADFAKGSRRLEGGGSADITRIRSLGNRFLSLLVNRIFESDYTDLCYGYNAFWAALPARERSWWDCEWFRGGDADQYSCREARDAGRRGAQL